MFNYDDPVVFTQNEQHMIDLLSKCFKKVNLSFSDITVQRRTDSYLTFLDKNDSDFLRIKVGVSSTWFSIDGCRLNDSLKEDPRFDVVAKKNIRHWKMPLKSIDDIINYVDIIIKFLEPNIILDGIDFSDIVDGRRSETPKEYIVFDFETTGRFHTVDKIIQIGALLVSNSKIIDTFQTFVNPQMNIPTKATGINKITNDDVKNSPIINDVLPKFLDFIGNRVLVGHNISTFDLYFLYDACTECEINESDFYYIDTQKFAHTILPELGKQPSLQTLCDKFGIINKNAHDALSDCYADFEVFEKLINISGYCPESALFIYNGSSNHSKRKGNYSKNTNAHFDITNLETDVVESIVIEKSSFVLTGDFDYGNNRDDIKEFLKDNGAIIKTSIPEKHKTVDYLILGNNGWKQEEPSNNYKKAIAYNQSHNDKILILKEKDFFAAILQENEESKKEYIDIIEPLRLKYNMTGKDGEILVNHEILKSGDVSYKVFNKLAVKVVFKKTFTRLLIKSSLLKHDAVDFGLKKPHPMNDDSDMQAIEFQLEDNIIDYINELLDLAIITYDAPKEFGCCSRYKECSDRKECINPNKIRAKQCYYRDNLENGIILY